MELSRELIIDVALNVAGYVTAGALWLVLWSLFNQTSKASSQAVAVTDVPRRDAVEPRPERRAEYISLKSDAISADRDAEERDRLRSEATRYQRNRAEVIRIAREMLRSGSSKDKVRTLLPISDGELALLANE